MPPSTQVALFHNNGCTQDLGEWLRIMNSNYSETLKNLKAITFFGNDYIYGTFPDDITLNFTNIVLFGTSDSDINGKLPQNMHFPNLNIQTLLVSFIFFGWLCKIEFRVILIQTHI